MKNFIDELFYGLKNTFVFITVFFITWFVPILGFIIVIALIIFKIFATY